jgi:GH25 family lysozyme M1 (1,4-beta-N-acetylmuramidase)
MKPIIDISFWQAPLAIDYDKLAEQVDGVILRAAYGTSKDIHFEQHYAELSARGVPLGAYHYLIGSQSMSRQAVAFATILDGKQLTLGTWMDVEDTRQGTRLYRNNVLDYAALMPDAGIYTSRSRWHEIMGGAFLTDRKLWVAHYTTASSPLMPVGFNSYWIWQYSSTGRLAGYSGNLDMNRFGGSEQEWLAWIGEEEEPEPEPEEPLFQARVYSWATPYVNVRAEPSLSSNKVGFKYPLAVTDVMSTVPDWYEVPEGWMMSRFLERLDDEPPVISTGKYYGALYWQRDPRWKDKPLGTSGTIGSYGCVMTAETNALNQLGIKTNPVANNAWRTENNGYHNGNLIVWEKVTEQHPDIIWEGKTWNPTDAQIKQKIADGCPLVMLVDHNEGTPALDEHWVNSIPSPIDDGAIWIHDPWDNSTIRLRDRYKKPIPQFSSYRRAL